MLEALEFLIRRNVRVLIVQVNHEADRYERLAIVSEMVEEAASAGRIIERPAHRVLDVALIELLFGYGPQLFQAEAKFLRVAAFIQIVLGDQLLRQRAPGAFGEQDIFAEQLHARLIVRLVRTIGGDPHDTGHDAFDFAIFTQHEI